MLPRQITPDLQAALSRQAAVALLGPRPVGKTTLAAVKVGESLWASASWGTQASFYPSYAPAASYTTRPANTV